MKTFSGWNFLKEKYLGAAPGKDRELADPGSRKYHRATEEGVTPTGESEGQGRLTSTP